MDRVGRVNGVVIDGTDTMGLARFWAAVFGTSIGEVERLGGSVVRPTVTEYGWDYAVVADPEGNEFYLIRASEGT
jgi:predicted enzyme related to lactoylglutathione lyase